MAGLDLKELSQMPAAELQTVVVETGGLPRHVAIIMDGNGRWAKKRLLPRLAGHRAGRHSVRRCVDVCGRLGVEALTLYTFSQENFNRPAAEVKALWLFLQETLGAEVEALGRQNVKLAACGDLARLPERAQSALKKAITALSQNTGIVLNLALAYGSRQEIVQAAVRLAARIEAGELNCEDVSEDDFAEGLDTADLPTLDLLIRTSGETRLSNFMLWQAAYAELLITPVLWPDFDEREMLLAIAEYQTRERRFGALPEENKIAAETGQSGLLDAARWKRLLKVHP